MKQTLQKHYEEFGRLVNDLEIWREPSVSFASICEMIKADESELETVILRELGMTGDEILVCFRKRKGIERANTCLL